MNSKHKSTIRRKIRRQLGLPTIKKHWEWKRILWNTYLYKASKSPSLFCEEIVGVQPMNGPTGQIFYLNIVK
jgi:hypothetical protein